MSGKVDVDKDASNMRIYHVLKEDEIKNLQIISDDDFSDIVDSITLNDYESIPKLIRLPDLNEELAAKLGLSKETVFVMKKSKSSDYF